MPDPATPAEPATTWITEDRRIACTWQGPSAAVDLGYADRLVGAIDAGLDRPGGRRSTGETTSMRLLPYTDPGEDGAHPTTRWAVVYRDDTGAFHCDFADPARADRFYEQEVRTMQDTYGSPAEPWFDDTDVPGAQPPPFGRGGEDDPLDDTPDGEAQGYEPNYGSL